MKAAENHSSDEKTKIVHLSLSESDHQIFRIEAAKLGISMQALLRLLIGSYLNKLKEKTP